MQIHNIQRLHKNKKKITVGRGSKRGKTSGRGTKGQKARAGHKIRPEIRDLIKRFPKLRGRGKNSFKGFQISAIPVSVAILQKHFNAGEVVSPAILVEKKLAGSYKGGNPIIKILSDGDLSKALTIEGCKVSKMAKEKIEKAGGTIK